MKLKFAFTVCCAALLSLLSATAATVQVRVGAGGKKFTPQDVSVQVGDTVQWVWARSGHSSTSGTPGHPDGMWDSGVQNQGFVYSQVFSATGAFSYYCTPHGSCCGMIGSVTVAAPASGALFINANGASNQVWMYGRDASGQLSLIGAFPTQGGGSAGGLSSQASIALGMHNSYLYAVNAGTNEITAFQVVPTGLTFIGKVASGGVFPNSIAVYGDLLYVLNARGAAANISGFRIQTNGSLVAIPNSTRLLSAAVPEPSQVGFTPDGTTLIVPENDTNVIDTYAIGPDGVATGPTVQASAGHGPFGFDFDNDGHLVVSEITLSSASSYTVSDGILQVVSARKKDLGKAACWVANTKDPTLLQQYSYVSNTRSDSLSGYIIAANGAISLLDANGKTAVLPRGAFPIDLVISNDNKYLYVLAKKLPGIIGFQIQTDGSLLQIQNLPGTPVSAYGMAGY